MPAEHPMTTAAAIPLQPIALTAKALAAGHPWPAIKNCLRMEANARIALAKLTRDENLDDLAHADYEHALNNVEAGSTAWEDVLREDEGLSDTEIAEIMGDAP